MKVRRFRFNESAIEPSANFTERVMGRTFALEKQRRIYMNALFAITAIAPFALRFAWSLVRSDFVSVSSLPMGTTLVKIYGFSMSYAALAVFLLLGIAIANRIYLGAWLKVPLQIWKTK